MEKNISPRLVSLDIFRGVTIGAMIIVNNLMFWSDSPRLLRLGHAEWNGCTFTDLIFPLFIFITGVSTVISLDKRVKAGESRQVLYKHVLIRSTVLFLLGLVTGSWFLVGWLFQSICPPTETQTSIWSIFLSPPTDTEVFFFSLANLRILGVLQRIALVYLIVSLLVIHCRWRVQAVLAGVILLWYWGLESLPGFKLLPGEDLSAFIDRRLIGEAHLWRNTQTWDPESLLGTLPAIATGLAGTLTGYWLRSDFTGRTKVMALLLGGLAGIVVGTLWGYVFPINKYLWTSSYVVYTAGLALVFLSFWYWLVDLMQAQVVWTKPFIWLGMNPLAAYCGAQVGYIALNTLYIGTPTEHTHLIDMILLALFGVNWDVVGQSGWYNPSLSALGWALIYLTFWTLLMGILYHKRIFIKI
jgi:predicted acyltransferase